MKASAKEIHKIKPNLSKSRNKTALPDDKIIATLLNLELNNSIFIDNLDYVPNF